MPKTKRTSERAKRERDKIRKRNQCKDKDDECSIPADIHPIATTSQDEQRTPSELAVNKDTSYGSDFEHLFHGLDVRNLHTGSIEIQTLDYFSQLLKTQFGICHGLLPPSVLYQLQLTTDQQHIEVIPPDTSVVQIHYSSGHYLVSVKKDNIIKVYDSLDNSDHVNEIVPQLQVTYADFGNCEVKYIISQHQGATVDCGAFAAANAYNLVIGKCPTSITLHQPSIRKHLRTCLENGLITDFPCTSRCPENMLDKYFCDQRRKQINRNIERVTDSKNEKEHSKYESEDEILNSVRNKRNLKQKKWREKLRCKDAEYFKRKRSQEQDILRKRLKAENPELAKHKRAREQLKLREKRRSENPELAKHKRAREQLKLREKRRSENPEQAKHKRAREQLKFREKRRSENPELAKLKAAVEQSKVREKRRSENPELAKLKAAVEQSKVREKRRSENPELAKHKRAREQLKLREKRRSENPELAKHKRAREQLKLREKRRSENPELAKLKAAVEQSKVREKRRSENPELAKHKRAREQSMFRAKQRSLDSEKAMAKRATEQKMVREKSKKRVTYSTKFMNNILEFPEYVCTSCNRMLYKRSVCAIDTITFKDVDEQLLHTCLSDTLSAENRVWLCLTCLRHIRQNKIPPQSNANNLKLPPTPDDLVGLTSLEERLLSQRYPFMKLLALPKGRQSAIKGAVVNIPVDVDVVAQTLPRTPNEAGFIPLKLKRKIEYRGHHCFQYIRPSKVLKGLQWLMKNNPLYNSININETWEDDCLHEDSETWNDITGNSSTCDQNAGEDKTSVTSNIATDDHNTVEGVNSVTGHIPTDDHNTVEGVNSVTEHIPTDDHNTVEDTAYDEQLSDSTDSDTETDNITPVSQDVSQNIMLDTCLQPSDLTLDANRVLSIAPGEGKKPYSILEDKQFEELSFPTLFPSGKFGYTYERPVKLSAKKYFQRRILESSLFSSNVEYLFVAQFVTEWQQIQSSLSIALRKSMTSCAGESCNAAFFKNTDHVRPLLTKDDAYRFLRPIRGSPPYWQKVMFELLAAIKQFHIFTWFLTLSAAEMRWDDTLMAIAKQQGRSLSSEQIQEMNWEEKTSLLRSNPTTAARHFHHRVQHLFSDVILSNECPLGKVTKYFYRIEFQQRGSPHLHSILWVQNAPQPTDEAENICQFVDKYVRTDIPTDVHLHDLVTNLQSHSHTMTCRKKGGACRFGYPKPVSDRTVLSKPDPNLADTGRQKSAIDILSKVKDYLEKSSTDNTLELTTDSLLDLANVSSDSYYKALQNATKTPTIFTKRQPYETCINNYNADILGLWKANMDLQYVTSPYAAIAYITSYITKEEREAGTILHALSKELKDLDIKTQMKKVACSFSNARNVSAQEAAYRLLGLPLHMSNFTTIWIPSGFPDKRIRILKARNLLESLDDDDENVFCLNIIDRYSDRPSQLNSMCLAEFAMWYAVSRSTRKDEDDDVIDNEDPDLRDENDIEQPLDTPPQVIHLTTHGTMKRRLSPAVIRFHQCSESKDPELYSYNRMLLFMPWNVERSDLLVGFETYAAHYQSKKEEIEERYASLMQHEELVQEALSQIEEYGPPRHAWDQIAPETEHTEADLIEEGYTSDDNYAILNPDSHPNATFNEGQEPTTSSCLVSSEIIPNLLNDTDYRTLVQSLNHEQRCVFQHILNWASKQCFDNDRRPEPFHIFVTGGAGTGKSHLIEAIHNMVDRELRLPGEDPNKPKVLLTAPTGTAAFNISGHTIHSALHLPARRLDDTYRKLSDSTCNQLRVQLCNLKLLIVDEISMVSLPTLMYIDKRLQQIKDSQHCFGGVSIIAVGDFYQLRPIGKYVFENSRDPFQRIAGNVWQELFQLFELHQIMRQKDDKDFAEMLNRVRLGHQNRADIDILLERNICPQNENYKRTALHIFARNAQTDNHNSDRLKELGQDIVQLTRKEKRPQSLANYSVSNNPSDTGGLVRTLELCVNARVMVIRNIDVEDGLVNGAQGTVVGFLPNSTNVYAILVKFDKKQIGIKARAAFPLSLQSYDTDVIPITRLDVSFSTSTKQGLEIIWTQFPLKLAFACTIHKVQGLSVDELVVSFESRFQPGQAYVALSRCRKLSGLQLLQFDPSKITQCNKVKAELFRLNNEMHLPNPYSSLSSPVTCETLSISHLNSRSLRLHFNDVVTDPITDLSDIVLFSETHIYLNQLQDFKMSGFDVIITQPDKDKCFHGLAVYTRTTLHCRELLQAPRLKYLECLQLEYNLPNETVILVLIYRSPSVSKACFLEDLRCLFRTLTATERTIIVGDFNEDALSPSYTSLKAFLQGYGFSICMPRISHKLGSCLDHVYLHDSMLSRFRSCTSLPTYFSDHYIVNLQIQTLSNTM